MGRLLALLLATSLVACVEVAPPPSAPIDVAIPHKWVAPETRSVVVRGGDTAILAADLAHAGMIVRIGPTTSPCLADAKEDLVVDSLHGPRFAEPCAGPPIVICRGREVSPRAEVIAFQDVRGRFGREVFSFTELGRHELRPDAPFVPVDRYLEPTADGRWSAVGHLVLTADDGVAIQLTDHEVLVVLDHADETLRAIAETGGAHYTIGKIRHVQVDPSRTTLAMTVDER